MIDLRSDTVTKPTPAMREAMMRAPVGDDVFGEDPSINALEKKGAEIFMMEDGLFCPSGTMTNQIALKVHTQPLDEIICDESSHIYRYEAGGFAFNSGCSIRLLDGDRGRINAEMIEENINHADVHKPRTKLVSLENTCNRGGGSYYKLKELINITELCRKENLRLHLDGARIFNALAETGNSATVYGTLFDSISCCLSKGLGAPVGSLLLGDKNFINEARRIRKVFGGGMRQAGILAAAGEYALDHNIDRLKEDHKRAKVLETALNDCNYIDFVKPVDTNIVIFKLVNEMPEKEFASKMNKADIKAVSMAPQTIRFVTHLDIDDDKIDQVTSFLRSI